MTEIKQHSSIPLQPVPSSSSSASSSLTTSITDHLNMSEFKTPLTPAPSPTPYFYSHASRRSTSPVSPPQRAYHNDKHHRIHNHQLQHEWNADDPYSYNYHLNQLRNRSQGGSITGVGNYPLSDHPSPDEEDNNSKILSLFDSVKSQFSSFDDETKSLFIFQLLSLSGRQVLADTVNHISPLLKRDPFTVLPVELSLKILSFVDDPLTLARASQVSRAWYLMINDDLTWKELCETHHFRRLSAAVNVAVSDDELRSRIPSVVGSINIGSSTTSGGTTTASTITTSTVTTAGILDSNELTEAIFNPNVTRRPVPTSYRSHFKQQYLLNSAWATGGRLAAKYVISNPGVVTALIMEDQYIVIALDNSKIFVFREDGRMLRSLFGHVMGVWALTLRGDTLVSGGCDRDVRVWDLRTGNCSQILRGHSSTVRCLQMVDEETAVSGSRDATVRIWDVKKGICKKVLEGHDSSVRCVEVNGDICVSGSYDFTAKVWRISDGTLLHTLVGHISQIYSLAFDGKRIATGSLDASIRIWDPNTGSCLAFLQGHTSLVGQLQMKGSTLVSGGSDGGIRVWDLDTYTCSQRFTAHDNSVTTLQFDEERIVSGGSDGKVEVWELATGKHIRSLCGPYDAVWRVAFKDEKIAILASRQQKIYMELMSFTPSIEKRQSLSMIKRPNIEFKSNNEQTHQPKQRSEEMAMSPTMIPLGHHHQQQDSPESSSSQIPLNGINQQNEEDVMDISN